MKIASRILSISCLMLAGAGLAFAQGGPSAPQGSSQPWRDIEKQLGLQTTYSVNMLIQAMGMNMESRVVRSGDKTRTEMTMPFMNIKMVMLEIPEGGRTVSYSLFPDKKKFMRNDDPMNDGHPPPAPRIEDLGTETFEGVACSKRRVVMEQDGVKSDMVVLLSPKVKDMPVKMTATANVPAQAGQPAMPMQSVILFRNYNFATPADSLFEIPADYSQVMDMMEIMAGDGAEGLGAMMQQMQEQMQQPMPE